MSRTLIGVSVGSGLEGADAALVRVDGVGLELAPHVERTARVPFPPAVADQLRLSSIAAGQPLPTLGLARQTQNVAETIGQAVRSVVVGAGISPRDVFAIGLLEPAHTAADLPVAWAEVADRVAEQTGLTVVHGFRGRDRAAGGTGHPIAAVADYLLFRHDREDR